MSKPTRIVLVDDHEIVRRGIADVLGSQDDLEVVGEAGGVGDGIDLTAEVRPDVVVLDVRLPDGSGIDACRKILEAETAGAVLVFSSFADPEALEEAFEAGALGFLLKRMDMTKLIDGIRTVARGEQVLDPEAAEVLEARAATDGLGDPRLAKLSPQEQRVLALIARGRTNREIAEEMDLAEKTVKNYVSNVLRKLDLTRRAEAAVFRASLGD